MKKQLRFFLPAGITLLTIALTAQQGPQKNMAFIENKGQLCDQYGQARPDILFSGNSGALVYHLRNNGISYQLNRIDSWKKEEQPLKPGLKDFVKEKLIPAQASVYRLDLEWLNINEQAKIQTGEALTGYSNYYNANFPNGLHNVRSYTGLTYKNIYNNIDLHYYFNGVNLEYDYLVAANTDYRQIKIRINGALKIELQKNGTLILQTPLGKITEAAPVVYQNKKQLPARWVVNKNELSFSIQNYNPALPVLIDPLVRTWGTFYGGTGTDEGKGCTTDLNNNVYMTGRSNSGAAIATSGSYMATLSGTTNDAFLVKFNSAGVRQWCTYYGGAGDDIGNACLADASGDIYMTGQAGSGSSTGIASPGTGFQGFNAGGADAFLVKFNSAGSRIWGTYYGGVNTDIGEGLALDPSSNIYMSGYSDSPNGFTTITSTGAHQTSVIGSAILIKFTPSGSRLWGTYYGDSHYSHGITCATDASGNVYMAGVTDAVNLIATPGAHQLNWVGLMDGFLVKFNAAGVRQWGTYYGDISYETINCCVTDAAGNVYIGGLAASPTGISTPGTHQPVIGTALNGDGMLVKFNSAGVRQWGTYYGGTTDDYVSSCFVNANGDIGIGGVTNSTSGIASANAYQPALAGGALIDGFIARLTSAGLLVWGTYYGGIGNNQVISCATDATGKIYIAGNSVSSGTDIASPSSHQPLFGGGPTDVFLVQFDECPAPASPVNVTTANNMTVCAGGTVTLNATGTGTISWYNSSSSTTGIGTGTAFTTPALSAGTTTFFAAATNSCSLNSILTPVTVSAIAGPATQISSSSTLVCPGATATLTASGANIYAWNNTAITPVITVTPSAATAYSVNGFSVNGCAAMASVIIGIAPLPTISINATPSVICTGGSTTLTAAGASQYTWNTTAGTSSIVVTPLTSTSYSVTGKSADGCTGIANINVLVSTCVGLKETSQSPVHIFPNPFKEILNITSANPVDVTITTIIGQVIRDEKLITLNSKIDLGNYPNGIYLVKITQGSQSQVYKMIKD